MATHTEFEKLLDLAMAEAAELTAKTVKEHALQSVAGWSLDEAQGRLLFVDSGNRYGMMSAQAVGLYEPAARQWEWAWNVASFPQHLVAAAKYVRDWGKLNAIPLLTEPTATLDDAAAWKLTAFAARLVEWPGIYRGTGGPKVIYLAFAPQSQPLGGPARPTGLLPPPKAN